MVVVDLLPSRLVSLPLLVVQIVYVALTAESQVASRKVWMVTLYSTGMTPDAAHLCRGGRWCGDGNMGVNQLVAHATWAVR